MTTQSPTEELEPTKSTVNELFWYAVFEATGANGKLNYEKLAEMTGYKNRTSAKAAFFSKRKQMRMLHEAKAGNVVKKEKEEEVNAGVKKRGRKKKETTKLSKEEDKKGYEEEDKKGYEEDE